MNTPHTPGPWAVDGQYIRSSQFHLAIMTRPDSGMMAEWRANRILISAAPELLAAAKCAVADLEGLLAENDRDMEHPGRQTLVELLSAIAKATGQTP